eukprot:scaffold71529_cov37-Prasinocladus_malaysianus.AAC.1
MLQTKKFVASFDAGNTIVTKLAFIGAGQPGCGQLWAAKQKFRGRRVFYMNSSLGVKCYEGFDEVLYEYEQQSRLEMWRSYSYECRKDPKVLVASHTGTIPSILKFAQPRHARRARH